MAIDENVEADQDTIPRSSAVVGGGFRVATGPLLYIRTRTSVV
jgi:hypothetical protein